MGAPIVAIDMETTGLGEFDEPWEVALIRRDIDGSETTVHMFVQHDAWRAETLPESFLADYRERFDPETAAPVAHLINTLQVLLAVTDGTPYELRPHLVGTNVRFDAGHLERLLQGRGVEPMWHHHVEDVTALAFGYAVGAWDAENQYGRLTPVRPRPSGPPWSSSEVSRLVGVDPDAYARHTALGDARWALAVYDAVMGGGVE